MKYPRRTQCLCCQRWMPPGPTQLCWMCTRVQDALIALVGRTGGGCNFAYGPTATPALLLAMQEVVSACRPELHIVVDLRESLQR